jgi:hypothetical protein
VLASCCAPPAPTLKYFPPDRDAVETVHALRYIAATKDWASLAQVIESGGDGAVKPAAVESFVARLDAIIKASESGVQIVRDNRRFEGDQRAVVELSGEGMQLRVTLELRSNGDRDVWMILWTATGSLEDLDARRVGDSPEA